MGTETRELALHTNTRITSKPLTVVFGSRGVVIARYLTSRI
jgi:hypothetical protein